MNTQAIKRIRRSSRIGLWGSLACIALATIFYFSPYAFYPTRATAQWMLIMASALAVLALAMALLVIRRRIPTLRHLDDTDRKLDLYADHIRSLYLSLLGVVFVVCLFTVLSNNNVLLMLALVTVLMLFLAFPNIYRIRADLGLSDEEMQRLFGDRYIPDNAHADQ